jgi:hypothetical protein
VTASSAHPTVLITQLNDLRAAAELQARDLGWRQGAAALLVGQGGQVGVAGGGHCNTRQGRR